MISFVAHLTARLELVDKPIIAAEVLPVEEDTVSDSKWELNAIGVAPSTVIRFITHLAARLQLLDEPVLLALILSVEELPTADKKWELHGVWVLPGAVGRLGAHGDRHRLV